MTKILGVDPGFSGGLAILEGESIVSAIKMPTLTTKKNGGTGKVVNQSHIHTSEVVRWIRENSPDSAMIEQVTAATPRGRKQGAVGMFRFGEGYGLIRGILAGLQIPTRTVLPAVWKRAMKLIGSSKDASRALADRLFPDTGLFSLKVEDGVAEAVLIARYGQASWPC